MLELHCRRRKKTAYIRNRNGAEKNERIGFRVADGVWQGQKNLEQVKLAWNTGVVEIRQEFVRDENTINILKKII